MAGWQIVCLVIGIVALLVVVGLALAFFALSGIESALEGCLLCFDGGLDEEGKSGE